ncbi:MAG: DUF3011 domain-containing protein [Proteobacteria bacterium]|nr:DUF3011 domain-containing protein [Pseudomonadota bacterium]
MRKTCVAVAAMGLLLTAMQANAGGELECRSSGYHYQYCYADTWNNVRLVQQMSNSSCDYGRSWGYDQRGIWVDNGCAARFEYGGGQHGGGHRNSGGDVVAGAAAAVILGAIISSSADRGHHHRDNDGYRDYGNGDNGNRDIGVNVPGWAIGHFAGRDRAGGPDIEIAVDPDGRIDGMQGSMIFDGQMRGTQAWIGNREYGVVRSNDGIRLVGEGRSGYDLYRE